MSVSQEQFMGSYRLLEPLGRGGMGRVYLAVDRRGRAVACKVLNSLVASDPEARARLAREFAILGRIDLPGVAQVVDADVDCEHPYLITQYIPGQSLSELVGEGGGLAVRESLEFAEALADAIDGIHAAGVIHRDIKPSNVLMRDGQPVLIDFGIAHSLDASRMTHTGLVMGTPGYLAPEVIDGQPVSYATDWWGWSATLLHLMTGRAPFGTGGMEAVISRVMRWQPDTHGLPPEIETALRASLHPHPDHRGDPAEVLDALRAAALPLSALGDDDLALPPAPSAQMTHLVPMPVREGSSPHWSTASAASEPTDLVAGESAEENRGEAWESWSPQSQWEGADQVAESQPWWEPAPVLARTAVMPAAAMPAAAMPGGAMAGGAAGFPASPMPALPAAPPMAPGAHPWPGTEQGPWSGADRNAASALAHPQGHAAVDPRMSLPAQTGPLAVLGLAFTLGAFIAPLLALVAFVALAVIARTLDRSMIALLRRRQFKGVRSSDHVMTALGSPIALISALVTTLVHLAIPLLVGSAAAVLVRAALAARSPTQMVGLATAIAMAAFLLMAWWGPGGSSLRRGSRMMARTLAPVGAPWVISAMALLVLAFIGWLALGSTQVYWWPLSHSPWPTGLGGP